MPVTKTLPRIRNVTASMVGLKIKVTFAKTLPKMLNPRDVAGNADEESRKGEKKNVVSKQTINQT